MVRQHEDMVKLKDIRLNPDNPRAVRDAKFEAHIESLLGFPQMLEKRGLVLYRGVVLGGNQRLRGINHIVKMAPTDRFAAIEKIAERHPDNFPSERIQAALAIWEEVAKTKSVPASWVQHADDWTDAERREFTIRDNVDVGEWDWERLANEWDDAELKEWGLTSWGEERQAEVGDDNYEIPDNLQTNIVLGDLIEFYCEDGRVHRLLCGDSCISDNWSRICGEERIDQIVTDPPYNVDYTGKTKDSLKIQNDKMSQDDFYSFLYDFFVSIGLFTKPGGACYVWHADSEGHNFRKAFIDSGFKLAQCLIWVKNSIVMGRQDYHWMHEPCLYGWKDGGSHNWYSDRKQKTVLEFDRPTRSAEHPTMKPLALFSYLIQNSSKKGDIIADGFIGSGTTMITSHELGRTCYAVEIDPRFCQVTIDRMMKLYANIVVKVNGVLFARDYITA